jgi:hypothetical protein
MMNHYSSLYTMVKPINVCKEPTNHPYVDGYIPSISGQFGDDLLLLYALLTLYPFNMSEKEV